MAIQKLTFLSVSGSGNWCYMSVSGSKNRSIMSVSGSRTWCIFVSFWVQKLIHNISFWLIVSYHVRIDLINVQSLVLSCCKCKCLYLQQRMLPLVDAYFISHIKENTSLFAKWSKPKYMLELCWNQHQNRYQNLVLDLADHWYQGRLAGGNHKVATCNGIYDVCQVFFDLLIIYILVIKQKADII